MGLAWCRGSGGRALVAALRGSLALACFAGCFALGAVAQEASGAGALAAASTLSAAGVTAAPANSGCLFNEPDRPPLTSENCMVFSASFPHAQAETGGSYFHAQRMRLENYLFTGAGLDLGGIDNGGWTIQQGDASQLTSYRRGIRQALTLNLDCRAIGDCANYFYLRHDGGAAVSSDEAVEGLAVQALESGIPYRGSVTGVRANPDRNAFPAVVITGISRSQPSPAFPAPNNGSNNWVTDGGILLRIPPAGRPLPQGSLSGETRRLEDYLVDLGLASEAGIARSTAWGTATAGYTKAPTLANVSVPIRLVMDLAVTATPALAPGENASPGAFTPGLVCIAGPWAFEQAVITKVDPVAPVAPGANAVARQVIYVQARYPNDDHEHHRLPMLFQGGPCGSYISADANYRFSGMRSTYPAFGSLTGRDLVTGKPVQGSMRPYLPQPGQEAWQREGPDSAFTLYEGAEIVANRAGVPELEPNALRWAAGDEIESPHHMTVAQTGLFVLDHQDSPTDASYGGAGLAVSLSGKGIAGFHKGIALANFEPVTSYAAGKGPLTPPDGLYVEGHFNDALYAVSQPYNALTEVGHCTGGFSLFDLPRQGMNHKTRVLYDCDSGVIGLPKVDATESMTRNGRNVCTQDGLDCPTLTASVTTTGNASDQVAMAGMTAGGHCSAPGATNAAAAANVAGTYVAAKGAGTVTLAHAAVAGMTYDLICTPN